MHFGSKVRPRTFGCVAMGSALLCIYYVSQLPCVRYYVFVKSSFKHTHEEFESKRAYVF